MTSTATQTAIPVQKGRRKRPPSTRIRESRLERLAPYGYVAPFFVIFFVFGLFPLLFTFYVALFDWNPIGEQTFVGLANFERLLQDPRFWNAFVNTFGIFLLSTIPQLALALLLAHLLNHATLKLANFFRMALLVPYITSVAATAIVFGQIFDKNFGLVNWFLELIGQDPVNFLASQTGSWTVISAMVFWRWFGYNTLLYLAGLQAIPREIYEAAAVDGASGWQQFIHLTIPSLRPIIIFTVIMSTIGGLQIFTEPLLVAPETGLTCGAARQCQTLALFLYEQGFGQFEFGYGSAIGVALFVIVVIAALINFFLSTRTRGDR
ncbi:carbohydrate ABC transporter permease [Microbacterium sp. TNHR37B]|jgi:cellobiose transport system permease protein|uniref:carbohydrate ABC transporter permease n=1 Tax=unclassified Microbacterium TaxID=2609290 RepID=UPI00039EB3E9|nr:sugar ABC transporter permease [Microbacterium sp. TNHR37B]KZE88426.1 L-arabinose transport system permease protein AraP [Microbacterium sp. TNHR37B]